MSKGELQIAKILTKNKIKFLQEKTFKDLKHGLFRFDFYVEGVKGKKAVIEVNGMQHYIFVSGFYKTHAQWEKAKGHDRQKISYCLANDIPIYIIPYWDLPNIKNIDDIFCNKYKAKNRWHNDDVWEKYQKER